MAEMMGGRRLESATKNRQERVLVNVVEEIAIASGVPVPAIYVIDSDGINAFHGPDKGILMITHYKRLLEYIRPDVVHVLVKGRIVESGDFALVDRLEREGYATYQDAAASAEGVPA